MYYFKYCNEFVDLFRNLEEKIVTQVKHVCAMYNFIITLRMAEVRKKEEEKKFS